MRRRSLLTLALTAGSAVGASLVSERARAVPAIGDDASLTGPFRLELLHRQRIDAPGCELLGITVFVEQAACNNAIVARFSGRTHLRRRSRVNAELQMLRVQLVTKRFVPRGKIRCFVWKPSLKAPLTAIATQNILEPILAKHGWQGLFNLIIGSDSEVGESMIHDRRYPLISATGSTRMGRHVGQAVAKRLGRSLLELGGNNAIIVEPNADLQLAMSGIVFGAVGTAGQRCTTTRRVFLHKDIAESLTEKLVNAYGQVHAQPHAAAPPPPAPARYERKAPPSGRQFP